MKRESKVLISWLVPDNNNEEVNRGKKWKFNKHVTPLEKLRYRTNTFIKNVEKMS
jgi:hypothetical protein